MAKTQKRATGGGKPTKNSSGSQHEISPVRRRDDTIGPQTRNAANQPAEPKVGGKLRNEILLPLGIGAVALAGCLGIVGAASRKVGGPTVVLSVIAAAVLIFGLMVYVAWILEGVASRPLARVRNALQEMEEGN